MSLSLLLHLRFSKYVLLAGIFAHSVFSFFSWDAIWLSKDQPEAREEPSGSNSLTKRHFPVPNSSYSGHQKGHIQATRQIPVFPSTLRNSHQWQWDSQAEEEAPGLPISLLGVAGHLCASPFSCAFVLKIPGDGEQCGGTTGLRFLFLSLKKFFKAFSLFS